MSHDVIQGILSGLIGPAVAKWAARFKYRLIFLVVVIGLYLSVFVNLVGTHGWHAGLKLFVHRTFNPAGILVPIASGLLAVVIVFISSLGMPEKKE